MGIVDYVCYVLQNGQYHPILSDVQCGPASMTRHQFKKLAKMEIEDISVDYDFEYPESLAHIVKIPKSYDLNFIKKQKFSWFAQFPSIKDTYIDYNFETLDGYYDHICNNIEHDGIWTTTESDVWYVCFNPVCYDIFVSKKLKYTDVKWETWATILGHMYDVPKYIYCKNPKQIYYFIKYKGRCKSKWN